MLTFSFTLVTLLALSAFGISYQLRSTDLLRRRVAEDNLRTVEQVNGSFQSYLRAMMRISDTMYYTVIKNADLSRDSLSAEMNLLYEANHESLRSIAVFDSEGTLLSAVPQTTLKPELQPNTQDWFQSALGKIENFHFSLPHVQNLFVTPDGSHAWVVSLSRSVELTDAGAVRQGVLLVDMNFEGLSSLCAASSLGESGYLYLIDSDGAIIYHPNQQLIAAGFLRENNITAAGYEPGNHIEQFGGEERMVTVRAVGYTGWKLVGVMPMRDIASSVFPSRLFPLFLILLLVLLIVAANLLLSSRITVPIKRLEQAVGKLSAGDLSAEIPIGGTADVQRLGQAMQQMEQQLAQLMDDIVREQQAQRKNELLMLQSQINPHFLYNTLDSIVWMVENENHRDAILMVTSLARLFRISLSRGRSFITLSDELSHAKSYLAIQQLRYKDKFRLLDKTDPALCSLCCLKLIVQPLLENAIYHGMEYMVDGEGEITLTTYCTGEDLFIEVGDNGPGIPPEKIPLLLTPPAEGREKKGYGIYNVYERIRLTFGAPYGLTILSDGQDGTTVRIHLPKKPYEALADENC